MTSCRILALDVVAEREFGCDENGGFATSLILGFTMEKTLLVVALVVVEKVPAHSSAWAKRSKVRMVEKRV